MAVKTWTGAGANENWNTGGNWSGGTIPAAGDDIIFDGVAPNGNKNCTLNVGFNALSANFTGYTGTFTFGASFTITSGTITLGSGSSYATNATPTSYTLTVAGTNPGLVSNNKILPVNLLVNLSGSTFTLTGNADFQGNLTAAATGHNIKAATGTTVDLRTGGNITLGACNINTTDHVTIKGYGTSRTYSSNSVCFNVRASFVSGSTYTSLGNAGLAGTSFLTVESGGQFNAVSTHSFSNGGNLTVSGFNASNNSDFYGYTSGSLILANDTVIKSFITIQATTIVITSVGSAKLLLEGNFIATGGGNCTIDRLEFSGTTASNITAVTASNLQIKEFIINKTAGGSVNFNSNGIFGLFVPSGLSYSFTHTSGTVTQNSTCIVRFWCNNAASTMTYSATNLNFRYLEFLGGVLNLNSELLANTLRITPQSAAFSTSITSSTTFGFTVENLLVINASGVARPITLKSAVVVYSVTANLTMLTTVAAAVVTLNASSAGVRAIFNLENSATQTVEYVNATDIDSSGTGGVLPYSKQTIYSFGGTIAPTTINWSTGSQPPPLAAKVTVAYTFVN
jgi:hypothetical protein